MKFDKGLVAGSSTLLVLALLEGGDMYGYQMIEELSRRSNDAFQMKEGTLYPILHALEKGKYLTSYQQEAPTGRQRKYYRADPEGENPPGREAGRVGRLPQRRGGCPLRRRQRPLLFLKRKGAKELMRNFVSPL